MRTSTLKEQHNPQHSLDNLKVVIRDPLSGPEDITAALCKYYTQTQVDEIRELLVEFPKWWCITEDQICETLVNDSWTWIGPEAIKDLCRIRGIRYSMRIQCLTYSYTYLGKTISHNMVRTVTKMFHQHRRVNTYIYHLARILHCKGWYTGTANEDVRKILRMSAFHKNPKKMHYRLKMALIRIYDDETLLPNGKIRPGCKHQRLELYDTYLHA